MGSRVMYDDWMVNVVFLVFLVCSLASFGRSSILLLLLPVVLLWVLCLFSSSVRLICPSTYHSLLSTVY
jgi:hypothetical protein